jgi:hypothetical protein
MMFRQVLPTGIIGLGALVTVAWIGLLTYSLVSLMSGLF